MIRVLVLKNQAGSVQNYSHFMYGFVFPLIQYYEDHVTDEIEHVFVRSCGPLDRLLKELAFPRLIILNKDRHQLLVDGTDPGNVVRLEGYDNWISGFDHAAFKRCGQLIRARLQEQIDYEMAQLPAIDLLLINRDEPDRFYTSDAAETPLSGSQRRSLPNFAELHDALTELFPNVYATHLENSTLAQQVALFSKPRIIVMQHGGAASNIVFSKFGTHLIEIIPETLNPPRLSPRFNMVSVRLDVAVRNLCAHNDAIWHGIMQEDLHSPVDVRAVIAEVRNAS